MTTGDKIALATLILGIVTALISGGWALYRFRWTSGHSKAPSPPPPDYIDGGSPASSVARASWRINHTGGA